MFQPARAQFKYVVKTSRSGKQGRKYIQVDKVSSDAPVILRKPVKKLSAKTVRESKSTVRESKITGRLPSAKILPGNGHSSVNCNAIDLCHMPKDKVCNWAFFM